MTYGILFAAALTACVLTIAAIGSQPPADHLNGEGWPQIQVQKAARLVPDQPLVAPAQ
ncbi:hypothetical protein [Oryzifoliimicrobium ureilyticus]|uniref:hypothetical protein n=1 Tax=Oryzifoliimicrobium ureilyticus TaxID=3113724 RepID=UPI0030760B33